MNNKILIIGNGSSVLSQKLGDKINEFPIIARINNYQINGYEDYIGSKTDIWINGANSKLTLPISIPNEVFVFLPSEIYFKKESNIDQYVSSRLKLDRNKFNIIPKNDILDYEDELNSNRLTTGLYAIMWALSKYENIYIHGFDFFINSKSHYYDSKLIHFINEKILNKGYKHDNEKEYTFVNELIKKNKIKRLIDIND
tara:strand:+ start:931 stop:1527 length:597 start_codon:yes stop_codon:yes gene_type:complete